MPVIPTDDEIPLWLNDEGGAFCDVDGCYWSPSQEGDPKPSTVASLADAFRQHALTQHIDTLGR